MLPLRFGAAGQVERIEDEEQTAEYSEYTDKTGWGTEGILTAKYANHAKGEKGTA